MSRRSRPSGVRLHLHCESCFSRRCRAPVEVSVSCLIIPCRLLCGALFHLCKEEEHSLLCPNERAPCLNAAYGCPIVMPRSWLAAHLQVCPASVVCCSMEWNRWPAEDAHSHLNTALHENLLREQPGHQEALDLAMATRDQNHLFHSLKMKRLFPELIERVEEEEREEARRAKEEKREKEARMNAALTKEAEGAVGGVPLSNGFSAASGSAGPSWLGPSPEEEAQEEVEWEQEEEELTQEEREALARQSGVDAELLRNYSAWERMFTMEMGGCKQAGKGAGKAGQGSGVKSQGLGTLVEESTKTQTVTPTDTHTHPKTDSLCLSSSSSSCLAKGSKSTFVYGHVEPMKIITVRTFKVPTSFTAKHGRIRNPSHHKRKDQAVDTSDLGVDLENIPYWEEVQASLLCSLEKELRGHLIAENTCTDALLQDAGTQTYKFLSAPFKREMSLADITADRPPELHVQLGAEGVTSRHNKASSAFTFLCGQTFLRREFPAHFRNVHSDIQMCLSGWFEQRCPLAYLGCTYSQRRFQPSTHRATVTYNQELSSFNLRPTVPDTLAGASQPPQDPAEPPTTPRRRAVRGGVGLDSLSTLPYEVLCHIASFLDSLSLSQLALVSWFMREVCSSLLQGRGMVTLRWEKKTYSHGGATWKAKKMVWQFSTRFSTVDAWHFQDIPPMSEHLKVCPYYETEARSERVLLPRVSEDTHTHTHCKGLKLINMFQKTTIF
ncbi:F-box only protein 40-like [Osmerus mordax]|uniref:F-box only protein 40-like n=1 Tax=Osmerus mordax TaxID=8014 RepID=UPI00350EA6D9